MNLAIRCVAATLAALLLLPAVALAHFGGEAFILVTADHVNPGEPFEVIVADLSPGSTTTLTVTSAGQTLTVGSAVSDTEGHFATSGTLPADFPHGYTELVATAQDGTTVSTWILVGPRTSGTGSPPAPSTSGGGIDPSLIVLSIMLGGSIGAVGYVILRRTQPAPERQPAAGRSVARKRSRRRSPQS